VKQFYAYRFCNIFVMGYCNVWSRVLSFYSTGTKWFHKILHVILCIDFNGLGIFGRFVAYNFNLLSNLVLGL
jgi:hypothetical protein